MVALRTLEERAALSRMLAERAGHRGHHVSATRFARQAEESEHLADGIRRTLLQGEGRRGDDEWDREGEEVVG